MAGLRKKNPVEQAAADNRRDPVLYKFVAYPICVVLAVVMFVAVLFVAIPCINQYAVVMFGDTIERLLVYYPSFLCLDIAVAAMGIWITFLAITGITGFCKKHLRSSKT